MKRNMGTVDRIVRVVVGLGLIFGFFLNPGGAFSWLYLLGIIPFVTALIGSCPAYSVLGISTCHMDRS